MVIRELNDFVKPYQSLINPLSPLSIPYQLPSPSYHLYQSKQPPHPQHTLRISIDRDVTLNSSTIVIDDKHPVTNTLIVSSLPPSGHSVFSAARCSLLRPHSPSRPLRRTQPQRHAHVALNRLLVRTCQRAQLLLEINLPISRKGILQTLPQILFFSLHALAVTNQIPLLRPHRIQNRL